MAVNKGNMVVLDACTLIHLFCTDVQRQTMLRLLNNQKICIPDMVYKEAQKNLEKLEDVDQKEYVRGCISQAYRWAERVNDNEIRKDLSEVNMDNLIAYTQHEGKDNGELLSVMLAAVKSRSEQQYVHFYTDDYPAQKEFGSYYRLQQIGLIGDTADYLVYLYWMHSDFTKADLLNRLQDLKAEYSMRFVKFLEKLKKIYDAASSKEVQADKSWQLIPDIEDAYKCGNFKLVEKNIELLGKAKNAKIKSLAASVNQKDLKECAQVHRLVKLINDIKRCEIWKLV